MSLQHHPSSLEQDTEEIANLRLRSRTTTSSTTTTSTTHSKPDQTIPTSLPSPVIPHSSRSKNPRGGGRKPNKSTTRRSSLNQKRDKKKTDSNSPPIAKNDHDVGMNDDPNITRCVCEEDNEEANDVIMFQCDKCSVWQHGPCVGLYAEFPGDYFCEKCRPDLHASGQYQKSSPNLTSRRSPSFTSSTTRRDRVNPDAASLAAFLTDAGVKPEDQISLGGFALPTFAQTRRQSNMLVDGVAPHTQKKQAGMESSPSLSVNGMSETVIPDAAKTKRKRPSLDQINSPTSTNADPSFEEKQKRPRISPAAELMSPAPSVSTTTSKQHNPPSITPQLVASHTKTRRSRKVDDTDDHAGPSNKGRTVNVCANKSAGATSTSGPGRRGPSIKRHNREDGRRNKNQSNSNAHHQEQLLEASLSEGWGLPDHLSYLDYLLPTPTPQPIILETVGESQKKIVEPPTKVKFPSKRTTIADLRKRSKHLVDYLQKVQIESCDREKRNELIFKSLESKKNRQINDNLNEELPKQAIDINEDARNNPEKKENTDINDQNISACVESVVSSRTLEIIDDLSRQLYHWQEKFKQN